MIPNAEHRDLGLRIWELVFESWSHMMNGDDGDDEEIEVEESLQESLWLHLMVVRVLRLDFPCLSGIQNSDSQPLTQSICTSCS